ncbi:MAG: LysR family transcriptional regulator [Deltaproteobacteria bacterium]|jgi:DNA-binding transcriptional LysR family regulator|nr:LysR family transcriptional regulator [Deltaproteobacteria bacterium]
MDLRRLEVFCKVYELKSFSRAGQACLLSQPTVSEHIRHLETHLDVRLFDRLGREVVPTRAGEILYNYARRMLNLKREASQTLARYRGKMSGDLELGGSTIPGQYILPSLIGRFREKFPNIFIKLVIADTMKIANMVLDGGLELGVVGAKIKNNKLQFEKLFYDELVLAVSPDHHWAKRSAIRLEELSHAPFIMREQGSGTRMTMLEILEQAGLDAREFKAVAEMGSTDAIRQAIKAKVGVSILSRRAIADELQFERLCHIPVQGLSLTRHFYLVTHKKRSRSPIGQAFMDYLIENRDK